MSNVMICKNHDFFQKGSFHGCCQTLAGYGDVVLEGLQPLQGMRLRGEVANGEQVQETEGCGHSGQASRHRDSHADGNGTLRGRKMWRLTAETNNKWGIFGNRCGFTHLGLLKERCKYSIWNFQLGVPISTCM